MTYSTLVVKNHLSDKELKEEYMNCNDALERSHWQIIWLMGRAHKPLTASETANITGFCSDWIRKLVRRYNQEGPQGIKDKRKHNGKEAILSEAHQRELLGKVQEYPEDGGLWTGPKVAQWIAEKINDHVSSVTGWKYLRKLGDLRYKCQGLSTRKRPARKSRRLLKKLQITLKKITQENPDKEVEVWAEDEARLGLQPVIRRMWALKAERPKSSNCRKYEWLYAYAFVRPKDGKSYWLLMPTVSIEAMNIALKAFAKGMNPNGKKIIVLLVDQAGFHMGKNLEIPEGIRIEPLLPYTPELQPVECLWPL